ncbi:ribonuclease E/G [Acetobacteraceae bacterium H6797]|nr:ribonuclease E/G [Acetobacteraceae bacterium H6797]
MADALILAAASPGEVRTALLLDDRLESAWVERPARPDGVGDLLRGRVSAVAPAMAGAFVTLPGGETGFLPESEAGPEKKPIAKAVSEGQAIALRVTRGAQGGKGPRLSARLSEAEAALIAALPGREPALAARGPIAALRLARQHPDALVETDAPALAATLRAALVHDRVALRTRVTLPEEFDALAEPEVPLPGGGRLTIHPTPALTAIDTDAGSTAGGRDATAHQRLNELALAEAARQIRLRNLAGAILIDIAGMPIKARQSLLPALKKALAADPLTRLVGVTGLGLFELQRSRIHPPLHEVLGLPISPLTHGLRALRLAAAESAASPSARLRLRAHPRVVAALRDWPGALEGYAAAATHPLRLEADPSIAPGEESLHHDA